ncbi:MAG: hypothetical protein WCS01_02810 [bacterium]
MSAPPENPAAYRSSKWSGKTRGGSLGNWFFLKVISLLGIRAAYAVLIPIAAYYLVASPRSVRNSRRYLRRVLGPQPFWRWPFLIYGHFFSLGMSLLDRSAMLMGRTDFTCTYEGESHIADALKHGKGVILVSAHVGNWAAGGHLLRRLKTRVNLVALENEVQRIQRLFDRAFPDKGFQVLSSSPDLSSSVVIMEALRNGEIVTFNGDRAVEGAASAEVAFFGEAADFPVGPYLLASVTGSPVIRVFAMRDGIDRYRFFCSPAEFVERVSRQKRKDAVRHVAADFAQDLEKVLRKYPFQWYNFYPFWKRED